MRHLFVFIVQIVCTSLFAQIESAHTKPAIDTTAFEKWTSVGWGAITHDGNYVVFRIENDPLTLGKLVIKSTNTSWENQIVDGKNPVFLDNSKFLVFGNGHDSVCILLLGGDQRVWLKGVDHYEVFGHDELQSLIYSKKADNGTLIVRNFQSGTERPFYDIDSYLAYKDNKTLFLKKKSQNLSGTAPYLASVNIDGFRVTSILSGEDSDRELNLNSIIYDTLHAEIVFEMSDKGTNALWCYQFDSGKAEKLIDGYSLVGETMELGDIIFPGFSKDGKRVFLTLLSKPDSLDSLSDKRSVDVDIWNYQDEEFQSRQLWTINRRKLYGLRKEYTAIIDIGDRKITRLNFGGEDVSVMACKSEDVALVRSFETMPGDGKNRKSTTKELDSLTSNNKRVETDLGTIDLSYGGRFLIGRSKWTGASMSEVWYVYDLSLHKLYNISLTFPPAYRFDPDYDQPTPERPSALNLAGWMTDDSAAIMYDKYDLWKVDPFGKKPAVNLTGYYGRSHRIVLRMIGNYSQDCVVKSTGKYILSSFNEETKEQGFFSLKLGTNSRLEFLSSGPYRYNGPYLPIFGWLEMLDSTTYLVTRESASKSPNYYITRNFRQFFAVSSVYPEQCYNWLSTKVIHWVGPDKRRLAGVIYKPDDFDPEKKYPVIVYYYEKVSQEANNYLVPGLSGADIDIPWFVSRGYVVFRPDISYTIGEPGESALQSVVSGTERLMQYKWINRKKIGIEGHSWGGYETDYIITHSSLYAAALSASGFSDFVSGYGSIEGSGGSLLYFFETSQFRMRYTPWERPDLYMKNTPIFFANKVTTPLLLMNNKADATTPFAQGIELFTALWRLGKKVWMLQYDGEGHSIDRYRNKVDYTIRMTQFFDYYLKGCPEPKWMSKGIPASMKGRDSGLEMKYN